MTLAAEPLTASIEIPLESVPGVNPFALTLVKGSPAAEKFVPRYQSGSALREATPLDAALVRQLSQSNHSWGNDVDEVLGACERGEAVIVIAGQQVGFAGGPLLTIAKIASLFSICADIESRGVRAVPFFWMATEDHDFDEVATASVLKDGALEKIHAKERPEPGSMVGPLPLPGSLVDRFATLAGSSEWLREEFSFRDSFAHLVSAAVAPRKLVLVDALLPRLRESGAELFRSIVNSFESVEGRLRARDEELRGDGFAGQVKPSADGHYSLLYEIDDASRRNPLRLDGDKWRVGERRTSREEVLALIDGDPQRISTGALARPLLQDLVFRPAVFMGGPAEVAYYAQVTALHELLSIPSPLVALRGHALAAPAKHLRALSKYGIDPAEIFDGAEAILERRETPSITDWTSELEAARAAVSGNVERLKSILMSADRSLDRSFARSQRNIELQFEKLRSRGRRAIARADAERFRAVERICCTLAPSGVPQDRIVNWFPLWQQYGRELVDRLVAEIRPASDVMKIVAL